MVSDNLTLEKIQNFEGKYPKQLWYLFLVEMWERFCFYGMRGVLTYFMVDQLLLKDEAANLQYGAIQAFVYAFTFIGGIFADKILGFKKSLLFGGIVMILGNLLIAFSPTTLFFLPLKFLALLALVFHFRYPMMMLLRLILKYLDFSIKLLQWLCVVVVRQII